MTRFNPVSWHVNESKYVGAAPKESKSVGNHVGRQPSVFMNPGTRSRRQVFTPLHYTPSYKYPLIVWLHSNGHNERQVNDVMPHISLRNFLALGVQGNRAVDSGGTRFDWHESPGGIGIAHDSVAIAIDEIRDRYSVHPQRIVLAGYGAGGTMALRLAMRSPGQFAAAVSLGGRMPQGAIRDFQGLRQRRLPMLWQWARDNAQYTDDNLKHDFKLAMTIGSSVEVRQYPGPDEMDTVVMSDLNDWIMRRVVLEEASPSEYVDTIPVPYSAN
ncbi:alpha/beta hydrolase [Rubripirellula amarantea]|nr:phospholipase [Rubripirellula amarantea]